MPLIKHHCKKRNKNFKKKEESIDNLIWKNQMQSIHRENRKQVTGSKKCWDMVNKITGRKCSSQCRLCSKPKCNQPLLQRDKYWYGIFCSSADSHAIRTCYSGSWATYCWKVLSKAGAQNLSLREAPLLDLATFFTSTWSGDHEAVQSFNQCPSCPWKLCQCDPYCKGITLN